MFIYLLLLLYLYFIIPHIYMYIYVNFIEFKLPAIRHSYFCFVSAAAILLRRLDHERIMVI